MALDKKTAGIVAGAALAASGLTGAVTRQPPPAPPEPIIKYEPVPVGALNLRAGFDARGQMLRFEVPLQDGGFLYGQVGLNTP